MIFDMLILYPATFTELFHFFVNFIIESPRFFWEYHRFMNNHKYFQFLKISLSLVTSYCQIHLTSYMSYRH